MLVVDDIPSCEKHLFTCQINQIMGLIPTGTKLRNNLGRVIHTYVPLSLSSMTWYWSKDSDILRLERWWKVMTAYHRMGDFKSHLQADCLYAGISSGPNAR